MVIMLALAGCAPPVDERIDSLMEAYSGTDTPGAALAVIHHGEKVVSRGFGMANIEEDVPVSPETNFRLASITKQFTAMAIMMLIERGDVHYETRLPSIFPEAPPYTGDITIRHLLQHNSGLVDYEDLIPDSATVQVHDDDVLAMMWTSADSTNFEPGSSYSYSNSGYAVLAMIVERISGVGFPEFLRMNIFEPLEMDATVAHVSGENTVPYRAYGYTVEADSVQRTDQSITSAVLGDGGIYSSLNDLYKWDQALYTDSLVSRENLELAFTPGLEIYGFGWRIDTYNDRKRYRHSGSTRGFRNFITRFPDDSLTVILLTNRSEPAVRDIAESVADLFLD